MVYSAHMTKATQPHTQSVKTKKMKPAKKIMPEIEPEADLLQNDSFDEIPAQTASTKGMRKRRYFFSFLALLIILGVALYKYQYLLIPAKVNGRPIFIWQYISYMHTTFGKDAMSTLTTQAVIEQEISKNKISISQADIDKEVDSIDKQASASGGLNALLAAQQMTMSQLRDQIRIQLAVKQILKDKIVVTDAMINDSYTKNIKSFTGVPEATAKAQIRTQLENQQFQTVAGQWLNDLRSRAAIQYLLPGTAPAN